MDWHNIVKEFENHIVYYILIGIFSVLILFVCQWWLRRRKQKEVASVSSSENNRTHENAIDTAAMYRFRKRDKVLFYGRKYLRKVKDLSTAASIVGDKGKKIKKRERVLGFAKKILRIPREPVARTVPKRPPSLFFNPSFDEPVEPEFASEVYNMLKSIRIFVHFEEMFFVELVRHFETVVLKAGDTLFEPGDKDDAFYVVKSGRMQVSVRAEDKSFATGYTNVPVKIVERGETIISLLSVMDVLTGHSGVFKTVSAKALVDSEVLKLGALALSEAYNKYPDSCVRAVQKIMMRLQRVTLTTLHAYLGLSLELITPDLTAANNRTAEEQQQHLRAGRTVSSGSSAAPRLSARNRSQTLDTSVPVELLPTFALGGPPAASILDIKRNSVPTVNVSDLSRCSNAYEAALAAADQAQPALSRLAEILGISDPTTLEDKAVFLDCPPGFVLTEQGSSDVSLIYVISGSIEMFQKLVGETRRANHPTDVRTAVIRPGELIGALSVLSGEPSLYTFKAGRPSKVIKISRFNCYELIKQSEGRKVVLNLANTVVRRMSPFVRSVDFALDSRLVTAGEAIYQQGDVADGIYITLCGRLRAVVTKYVGGSMKEEKELVEEYGRGDIIGLFEMLTENQRSSTVMAIRYSELAKIPQGLWTLVKMKYPQTIERMFRILAKLLPSAHSSIPHAHIESMPSATNLNTIAIIGVSKTVPITAFTCELYHSMQKLCSCLHFSSANIRTLAGPTALDSGNDLQLFNWLSHQEEKYPMVLYECDFEMSSWTRRCVKQADCILIVADAAQQPAVGPVEKQLEHLAVRAQKELILLWRENQQTPVKTALWLNVRDWVSNHYHVKCPNRMFKEKIKPADVLDMYAKSVYSMVPDKFSDFSRLARTLTGESIGLVLGGGGARGASHIGIIKAMKECCIPIDYIGGVSIGSFIGGLYASNPDIAAVTQRARDFFSVMSSFWNKLLDLTYPSTSFMTGRGFNNALRDVFQDVQIEDLWLPYFCVTTDITASEMRVHRSGSLWIYVRASMSYACILPPMCDPEDGNYLVDGCYVNNLPGDLWQYCRASMSLAGYLPPLCDSVDGHYLLDGGYVNNLPGDVMRNFGVRNVIAVDVGGEEESNLHNYGDHLSGFSILWDKWKPWSEHKKILTMSEIQSRLAYVSCMRQLEIVKNSPYCLYVRPPVERYQTMDFKLFDDILVVGYKHGKVVMEVFQTKVSQPSVAVPPGVSCRMPKLYDLNLPALVSSISFTDLAAITRNLVPLGQSTALSLVEEGSLDHEEEDDIHDAGDGLNVRDMRTNSIVEVEESDVDFSERVSLADPEEF